MSAAIAHAADAVLVPSNSSEIVAPDPPRPVQVQTVVARDPEGAGVLTRVNCPTDPNTAEHEVLITSLQDLQTLEERLCEMRP
jgi:hypothetical protein